jgi:tripartite-type tricarboxylate transporter receptor subunit TctC
MRIARRHLLAAPILLAAPAHAQGPWPNRPVRFISPFAPGGPQDLPGRFICDHLAQALGQPFILESRAGAGGAVGMQYVAQATDQHTFLLTSSAIATLPAMRRDLGFDPFNDLPAVSLVTESPLTITTRAQGGFADLATLLAKAKAEPGRVSFATSGIGSATHFAGELLAVKAGVRLLHVPYRGASVALNALLAGDVDLVIGDVSIVLEHIRAGSLRALATSLVQRTALLPQVPAVAEQVPGYAVPFWIGLFAARATPSAVIAQVNAAMAPLRQGELAARMAALGATLPISEPAVLAARLRHDVPQWQQVAQAAGIVPE